MSTIPILQRAWRHQEYIEADGCHKGPELVKILELERGDELYDFGCGDGNMVDYLSDRGMKIIGLDMIKIHSDTILCNLMEISDMYSYQPREYGLCLGVMDHIPEDRVAQTLINLNHLARGEIYFTIPVRDLGYNDLLGKKIQQTIKSIGWWRNRLTEIGQVKIGQTGDWMTAHVQCH